MAMTGTDALNRSQASAEAEAGSIDSPVKECLAWIGVAAVYDDPWATPVTGCQVRIKVEGELVADGPRTKGLSAYGKEDGQPHGDVRAELGVYRQSGVRPGSALIALVPDGNDDPKDVEKQILSKLETFETSMRELLHPWLMEWSKDGWLSIPEANRRGLIRGLGAWWEGEVDFWTSVGDGIKRGASKVADWYEGLPWYEKLGWAASPTFMVGVEVVKQLTETAQTLWDRREQVMNLIKAFHKGTAAAIENALEALVDLPGDLGGVIKKLVQDSAEWVQNMIEVARETDVFKRAAKTIMTVVMMMTPNFWAEGVGMVGGYLLPEVLITIVLIIIAALCTAAGAGPLAARVTGVMSKMRVVIEASGSTGRVLTTLLKKVDEVADLIGKLSKALRRRIDEVVEGVTERRNQIVRRSSKAPSYRVGESDGGPGKWAESGKRPKGEDYQEQITGAPRGTEYEVPAETPKGKVMFDGYKDGKLLDAKDWSGYPPANHEKYPFWQHGQLSDARKQLEAAKGTPIEWHFSNQENANIVRQLFQNNDIEGIVVKYTPKLPTP